MIMLLLLCACGREKADVTVISVSETRKENAKISAPGLSGEWYGWWKMYNTSGDWKDMHGYWWDCCMELTQSGDGATFLIWDEDLNKENYLAKLNVKFKNGTPYCTGGEMMDITLSEGECKISLGTDSEDGETMITLSGTYKGEHKGKFDYIMYLKPWGAKWHGDELPYYYEQWYLPLVEAGKSMPDEIGK